MSEALDVLIKEVNSSPPERKLIAAIERTNLSADVKAILCDLARITIRVGGKIVAIGRRILSFALDLLRAFPSMALGAIVALILTGVVADIPAVGKWVASVLSPLLLALGIGLGALNDMSRPDFAARVDALIASFKALVEV